MCLGRSANCACQYMSRTMLTVQSSPSSDVPLNTRQDGRDIVRGRPSVLENVQTQLARSVYVGVKHLADELDTRRLVGIRFFEMHDKAEGSIFERRVSGADDDCIPVYMSVLKFKMRMHAAAICSKHGSGFMSTILEVACGVDAVKRTKS